MKGYKHRHCEERSNPGSPQDFWIASQARNDDTHALSLRFPRHCEERSNPGPPLAFWIASQARNDGEQRNEAIQVHHSVSGLLRPSQ